VLLFGSSCSLCVAQWDVPVRIELTGSQPADRQVLGLADPAVLDAGTSAEAVRSNAVSYTTTQGSAVLTGALIPAPQAYVAGMVVSVLPDEANESGAQIDLNGLGPRAIMKTGGLPLDSADLIPGSPVRLVYDGDNFIVLGPVYLPCPAGYHVGSREYCIEDSSRAAVNFYQATAACINSGARLCSFSEWIHACRKDPGFITTVSDYEWVDQASNHDTDAKRVGYGENEVTLEMEFGCNRGGTGAPTNPSNFRCCTNR